MHPFIILFIAGEIVILSIMLISFVFKTRDYRIVKITDGNDKEKYMIQEKIIFGLWIKNTCNGYYYHRSLADAKIALNNIKATKAMSVVKKIEVVEE
jgi:hypothetical protein